MTRAASPRLTAMMASFIPPWMGGHPNSDPGPRPWNNSPAFIHVLRNKQSFTVDSRVPEGLALVKQLIRMSDVLAENLAQGTLEKLGLDDATIRAERPDIVILHMPAFGRSGDYLEGVAMARTSIALPVRPCCAAIATRLQRRTWASSRVITGVGMHGAFAVMAALRHRRRTGEGQVIELAQVESSAQMFPQAALDAAWNGRAHESIGNRSIEGFVPNGVFPCAGADRWIAISCRSDEEWAALVKFMGSPAWATGETLSTRGGREAAQDQIEERIAEWTSSRDQTELFHALQTAGVTAGPVMDNRDAANDPHLAATGSWMALPATADYPATEFTSPAYRFSRSDVRLRTAPALFGEHNDYVYRELLQVGDEEYERLRAAGHITDTYDVSVIASA